MSKIILGISKLALKVASLIGKGSGSPGQLALKLSPNLLHKFNVPKNVIMVTGTNGKTSVTKYIVDFYRACGYEVTTNDNGANVYIGITTTLIKHSDFSMNVPGDVLVLEVDEGNLGKISEAIHPDKIVITNLFQDQVDRFGGAKELAEKMAKSFPNESALFVNSDDPMASYLASLVENEKTYYSVDSPDAGCFVDVKCPKCGKNLEYSERVYDHLGVFNCSCGYTHQVPDFVAENVHGRDFTLAGREYKAPEDAIYMVYNSTAALSVGLSDNLSEEKMYEVLSTIKVGNGRLQKFKFNGHDSFLNLVKNPAGANLSIDLVAKSKAPYNLLIGINRHEADGFDDSWVESILFEQLKDSPLNAVYVLGESADLLEKTISERLPGHEVIKGDANSLISQMETDGNAGYFLANYTMLAGVKSALKGKNYL